MKPLLRLGRMDETVGLTHRQKTEFFDRYHHPHGFARDDLRFRDDSRNAWRKLEATPGERVRALTRRLQQYGFMPHASHDGIFGYVTQAAVRLFQEYVRTVGDPLRHAARQPASWPDGVVGSDTQYYLDAWETAGHRSRWVDPEATQDYAGWIDWLHRAAGHYRDSPTVAMRHLIAAGRRGDSLVPADWQFSPDEPHLIGIRRLQDRPRAASDNRPVDDHFVLLISGRSFYFRGSTDPNPSDRREAYLVEGQHRYRFNWHNVGASRRDRIYKAGRPAGAGVMVLRDRHGDNALTARNLRDGFDPAPNPTINIHWSGVGRSNWSAGCQVIAGGSYLDDRGTFADCREYTARNDRERGQKGPQSGARLTMGAYTFLSDLLLCYTAPAPEGEKPVFRYTLLGDDAFDRVTGFDPRTNFRKLNP